MAHTQTDPVWLYYFEAESGDFPWKQETAILGESDLGVSPAHEFHYFDSDNCGTAFHASKPESKRGWDCMHGTDHLLAGFPHLYYYANPKIPQAFLKKCLEYKELQK